VSAIPDLRSELDRKTMETIEWLFNCFKCGRISPNQFSTGIDAIFMATSGLVDDDILKIVTAADEMISINSSSNVIARHFIKGDSVMTLSCKYGSEAYSVRGIKGDKETNKTHECETTQEALAKMTAAAERILSYGYKEL
jgi:hypothetical protein